MTRSPLAVVLALALTSVACGGGGTPIETGTGGPTGTGGAPVLAPQNMTFDAVPLYREAGLLARGLPMPFVGRIAYLASGSPDSTHALVALAIANSALSFTREADDRFRANYTVAITIRRGAELAARAEATEEVIVGAFRETTRDDETLVFQQILDLAPGSYDVVVVVRDEGSQRNGQAQGQLEVPRLGEGTLTSPLPILEATPRTRRDTLPDVLASPRATVVFGRDTVIPVYVEQYGSTGGPARLEVRNDRGRVLWSDTVDIPVRGTISSQVIDVPVSRIGIGIAELAVTREGVPPSPATTVFVGFGDDLPVATFENMLTYLRYFARAYRLDAMRQAPEEERPERWANFLRETDPVPTTAAHEDLRAYFTRLVRANSRFRDGATIGWLSDRGRVYVTLGEPDQVMEPQMQTFQRTRQQVWEYRSANMQLIFYDETGAGRWRLTQSSATRFESEFQRRLK